MRYFGVIIAVWACLRLAVLVVSLMFPSAEIMQVCLIRCCRQINSLSLCLVMFVHVLGIILPCFTSLCPTLLTWMNCVSLVSPFAVMNRRKLSRKSKLSILSPLLRASRDFPACVARNY